MSQAIPVHADYTAGEVRQLAKRAKDAAPARRSLAIAAVLDGASREAAAKVGGMDRQTLRDWVIRFNAQGAIARRDWSLAGSVIVRVGIIYHWVRPFTSSSSLRCRCGRRHQWHRNFVVAS